MKPKGDASRSVVAVVGATGWIGQAVVLELVSRGHAVLAVSRRPPGKVMPRVQWRQIDSVATTIGLAHALRDADSVINVAGAAHVADGHPSAARWANEELPALIGAAARAADTTRLIHVSSIKAMGEGGPHPIKATDAPNPSTSYGWSKLAGELAMKGCTEGTPVRLTIVRPPMVYGPQAPANFRRLLRIAASPLPVPLPAPYPLRSLIYLRNLADLLVHLAVTRDSAAIVHCADTPHLTTRELVSRLSRAVGAPDLALPLPVRLARTAARAARRQDDFVRLTLPLIVEPSEGTAVDGWRPPFVGHQGLDLTVRAGA